MSGEQRRKEMLEMIRTSSRPVPGAELARCFNVSRQVIVQDIALLRAKKHEILSTNRGYLLQKDEAVQRIFRVCHSDQEIEEELNVIVDFGGIVRDVFIEHALYGELRAELMISSRKKVREFIQDIEHQKASPLKNITSGYHYHTVEADTEETLDEIERELEQRHFLEKDSKETVEKR